MSDKKTSMKYMNEEDDRRESHRKGHRRDSRHSPDKHSKSESSQSSRSSDKNDRNVGHYRRYENRANEWSKRRDHGSDRKDKREDRRDDRNRRRHGSRSKSRSRSRSRERLSQTSSSRRDDKIITKKEPTVDKVVTNESKPEKGVQHKNSLEIMRQQIKEKTGISVPEYYNPGVVNPIKFAEQEKKRKLLWSREDIKPQEKKTVSNTCGSNPWNNLKFEGEKGNAMTEKFRKLMGIKDKDLNSSALNSEDNKIGKKNERNESAIKSQETLFRDLDLQYSIARISTHTQRGVGLGFGLSQNYNTSSGDK